LFDRLGESVTFKQSQNIFPKIYAAGVPSGFGGFAGGAKEYVDGGSLWNWQPMDAHVSVELLLMDAEPTEWVMPRFESLCGHRELADVVLSWRRWFTSRPGAPSAAAPRLLANISDDGLRRLFEYAHFASCIPEEGRYSRLALFVRSRDSVGELTQILSYRNPIPLSSPRILTERVCEKG